MSQRGGEQEVQVQLVGGPWERRHDANELVVNGLGKVLLAVSSPAVLAASAVGYSQH